MNIIVTTDEIKTFLGITGSGSDTVLAMLNKFAHQDLFNILNVNELDFHLVEEERHDACGYTLELKDIHVQEIVTILDDTTEYTQTEDYDIDDYVVNLEDPLTEGFRKAFVTYAAGWYAAGHVTLEVTDYSTIVGASTITIDPAGASSPSAVVLTSGTDFTPATSNEVTAARIATAINANATLAGSTGVRAVAVGAVVHLIDRVPQRETSTVALSVATGYSLSAATLTGTNMPESLREAIMLLVGGALAKRKNTGVSSYTIGSKSVTFSTAEEANRFKEIVKPYIRSKVFVF